MKKEQFNRQAWKPGMKAKYHGGEFEIAHLAEGKDIESFFETL